MVGTEWGEKFLMRDFLDFFGEHGPYISLFWPSWLHMKS